MKGGGGIVVYVHDNIAAVREKKSGELLKYTLLDVYMKNRCTAIWCACKPPSVDNATFSKELSTVLNEASKVSQLITILKRVKKFLLQSGSFIFKMVTMLQIPQVFPCVSCCGSAKVVQCPHPKPKIGDESQQIPCYSPICLRGQSSRMAADKCISL